MEMQEKRDEPEKSVGEAVGEAIQSVADQVGELGNFLNPELDVDPHDIRAGGQKLKPNPYATAAGTAYYCFVILLDFLFCILYLVERANLFYLLAPPDATPPFPPVDFWYDSRREEWLRWFLFSLAIIRVIPFTYQVITSFGGRLLRLGAVLDIVTIVGLLLVVSPISQLSSLWVPYFLRCWGIVRESELLVSFLAVQNGYVDAALGKQIFVMVVRIVSVLFTALCSFEFAETSISGAVDLFDAFYFSVVTLSTVGYGDVLPHNVLSKLVVMVLIVCIFTLVPAQVGRLIEALNIQKANGGSFSPTNLFGTRRHVIVCGSSLDEVNISDILSYFKQKRSKVPDIHNQTMNVVFLLQKEASQAIKKVIDSNPHKGRVTYLVGTATYVDDLKRAGIDTALAVFILSDYYDNGLSTADERNAFRVWTIHDTYPHVPVYIYSLKEASTLQFKDYPKANPEKKKKKLRLQEKIQPSQQDLELFLDGKPKNFAKVNISNQTLKMAMMGNNTLVRGSIPFVANLFKLSEPMLGIKERWMDMYSDGSGNEIYQNEIPSQVIGKTFTEAAYELFVEFEVILLGVKSKQGQDDWIIVNPGTDYVLKTGDQGFYIAQDDQNIAEALLGGPKKYDAKARTIDADVEKLEKKEPADIAKLFRKEKHQHPTFRDVELYEKWEDKTCVRSFPWASPDSNLPLCQLLKEPASFEKMNVEPGEQFSNHVIVIANGIKPEGLLPFCATLRSPYLHKNDIPEILIVTADEVSVDQVDDLLSIPHLYVMTTRISKERDLAQTGLYQAREVVIFSNPSNWQSGDEPIMVDRAAIGVINKIRSMRGESIKITVELIFRSNWKFIPPKPTTDDFENPTGIHYLFTPAYICGNIFSPTLIEGLLYQTFLDRPDLPTLVSLLLGVRPVSTYLKERELGIQSSYLRQIKANSFVTEPKGVYFGAVFRYLLKKGIVALAICKMPSKENGAGYMHTNPFWQARVEPEDRLYVLMASEFAYEHVDAPERAEFQSED